MTPSRNLRLALPLAALTLAAFTAACIATARNAGPGPATAPTSQPYASPQGLPTVPLKIGSLDYTVEIVKTPADRQRGLMFRPSMPENWGMIFVFPETVDASHGFWMKNTLIPLDIVYIAADGKVVSTHHMYPHDETSVNPTGPYKYAVELNAGQVAKTGIKPGDVVVIPSNAKETTE